MIARSAYLWVLLALATPAHAILDANNDGLSDLWEKRFNNGKLVTMDPNADPDGDGWTNAEEAIAGTDPYHADGPTGMLRPVVTRVPEVLDNSGPTPVQVSPEAVTITWPSIPGKRYTLFCSPNLAKDSWCMVGAPFVAAGIEQKFGATLTQDDGSTPRCLFWRLKVEDLDTDGDGLTDAEEYELGTDPTKTDTDGDGFDDKWEVMHGLDPNDATGINGPNGDLDGDGLTNEQERELGTDPAVPDNPGIAQETIVNGDFSTPTIGSGLRDHGSSWDYWAGISGWQAVVGSNIELQNFEASSSGGQYCELKAQPTGHYGIKQKVGTQKQRSYMLLFDCKARRDMGASMAANNFSITIDDTEPHQIIFTDNGDWQTRAVSFTATKAITSISLVPTNEVNSTVGCLIDNIRLSPVAVHDNIEGTGVDDLSISVDPSAAGHQDAFWIMAPLGGDEFSDDAQFDIPLDPAADLTIDCKGAKYSYPVAKAPGSDAIPLKKDNPPMVRWRGDGTGSADITPTFKIGPQSSEVELPIRVKAMKKRDVSVVVHYVTSAQVDPASGQYINLKPPTTKPTSQDIIDKLNQVFGRQINAWFDSLVCVEQTTDWDIGVTADWGTPQFPINSDALQPGNCIFDMGGNADNAFGIAASDFVNTEEQKVMNLLSGNGSEIHVFVLGGCRGIQMHTAFGNIFYPDNKSKHDYTRRGNKVIFIAGEFGYNTSHLIAGDMIQQIAHEIGHIMIGDGCPDQGGGPAPLMGTPQVKRLMYSDLLRKVQADALDTNILVKGEWDAAEDWLKQNID